MTEILKRTVLFERHVQLGGRMVPFGGWEMPVQYDGIKAEHLGVRKHGGIFDISHMGEFMIQGPLACSFLNQLLTNNVEKLHPGQGQYTLMCQENGGVIDDLYLYCLEPGNYLMIVNAARSETDWQWLETQWRAFTSKSDALCCENQSDSWGAIAIQGPKVRAWIDTCFLPETGVNGNTLAALAKNHIGRFMFKSNEVWIGVTGYTGEDGFEVIAPSHLVPDIWDTLLLKGQSESLQPAGLGARDTLRTEMCYPLYGQELTMETTPIEAGLGFFVDLEKGPFMGREILSRQKRERPEKRSIAFKMTGRSAPPRPGYQVFSSDDKVIGTVTSGTASPSLNQGIGLAYVWENHAKAGQSITIEIRGNRFPAIIVKKPIYRLSGSA